MYLAIFISLLASTTYSLGIPVHRRVQVPETLEEDIFTHDSYGREGSRGDPSERFFGKGHVKGAGERPKVDAKAFRPVPRRGPALPKYPLDSEIPFIESDFGDTDYHILLPEDTKKHNFLEMDEDAFHDTGPHYQQPIPRRGPALPPKPVQPIHTLPLRGHRFDVNPSPREEYEAQTWDTSHSEWDIPPIKKPQMRKGLASTLEGINTFEQKLAARKAARPRVARNKARLMKRSDIDDEIKFPTDAEIKHPQMHKGLAIAHVL